MHLRGSTCVGGIQAWREVLLVDAWLGVVPTRTPNQPGPVKMPESYFTQSVYEVDLQSQFPHKSVNLLCTLVTIKDTLTDMCGN